MFGSAGRLWLPLCLLLLALLLASCGPGQTPQTVRDAISPAVLDAPIATGRDLLVPLPDGPSAFAAIESQLRSARRAIQLEMYEFQRQDLASLVVQAHDRGVSVTAIMDPSEQSSRPAWSRLQQAGVKVVAFPVEPRTIDHVKMLIVDQDWAIVGGINWGTHSVENRDYDVAVSGPVVANLERIFNQDLLLSGEPGVLPPQQPDRLVQVLVTRPGDGIRSAALAAISTARRTIDIEMYVLSDGLVLEALTSAASRRVAVRVLLDPGQPQNLAALTRLRAAGANAHFLVPAGAQKLHAKMAIFDEATVLFGSCNWSRSGFTRNHELDLLIDDRAIATIFLRRMAGDWAASVS